MKSCLSNNYLSDYIEQGKLEDLKHHHTYLKQLVYQFDTATTFQDKVTIKVKIDRVHGLLNIYSLKHCKKVTFSRVLPPLYLFQ